MQKIQLSQMGLKGKKDGRIMSGSYGGRAALSTGSDCEISVEDKKGVVIGREEKTA